MSILITDCENEIEFECKERNDFSFFKFCHCGPSVTSILQRIEDLQGRRNKKYTGVDMFVL